MFQLKILLSALVCLPAFGSYAEAQLVFPHVAQGGGYQTTFTFVNLSDVPATVTLQVFPDSGTPMNSLAIPIAANGSVTAALSGATLTVGWAQTTVSPRIEIAGSETIQLMNGSRLISETTLLPAVINTNVRIPVTQRDGISTGIAVANPSSMPTNITLILRDAAGRLVGTQVLLLGVSQHRAAFIPELFHGIVAFDGSLEIDPASSIAVFALRQSSSGIFSALPVAAAGMPRLDSFFSPNGAVASRIVQEIRAARTTIDIAIYSFTENEIGDALIAARNRGVAIRIVADADEAPALGSEVPRLETAGISLKRATGTGGGIMHNKYAIFDRQVVLTGSYNWSQSAEKKNFENAIFIREAGVVSSYQTNFDSIWSTR